jgi:hypothetical protein
VNAAEDLAKAIIENYDNPLQRYKAFCWRPNRPTVRETESRDTVLRHGGPRRGGRGIHGGENSPFPRGGTRQP